MKIIVGSDHAGVEGREAAIRAIRDLGPEVIDLGTASASPVDYPDYAHRVAEAVESGEADFGVLVCGTGQGMAMAANRHRGVRAAVIGDELTARMARAHNDANVACFGQRMIGAEAIPKLLQIFLGTEFEGERHQARIHKIECDDR